MLCRWSVCSSTTLHSEPSSWGVQVEEELGMLETQQQEHERMLAAQLMSVHDRHLADMQSHEQLLQKKLQECSARMERYRRRRRLKLW